MEAYDQAIPEWETWDNGQKKVRTREPGKGVGSLGKIRTAIGDPGAWSSYLITGSILNVEKPILFLIKKIYCPPISNSNFSGMDFFFCQCLYFIATDKDECLVLTSVLLRIPLWDDKPHSPCWDESLLSSFCSRSSSASFSLLNQVSLQWEQGGDFEATGIPQSF